MSSPATLHLASARAGTGPGPTEDRRRPQLEPAQRQRTVCHRSIAGTRQLAWRALAPLRLTKPGDPLRPSPSGLHRRKGGLHRRKGDLPAPSSGNGNCRKAASEARRRQLRVATLAPRRQSLDLDAGNPSGPEICGTAASKPRHRHLRVQGYLQKGLPQTSTPATSSGKDNCNKAVSEPRRRQLRVETVPAERQSPKLDAGHFEWQGYLQNGNLQTSTPAPSSGKDICRRAVSEPRRRQLRVETVPAERGPQSSTPVTSRGNDFCKAAVSEPRRRQLRVARVSADRQPPNLDTGNSEWQGYLQKGRLHTS